MTLLNQGKASEDSRCVFHVRQEEEKAEVVEYEQLQNELLMKDMELRQSYVKESMMNEGATLRSTLSP